MEKGLGSPWRVTATWGGGDTQECVDPKASVRAHLTHTSLPHVVTLTPTCTLARSWASVTPVLRAL